MPIVETVDVVMSVVAATVTFIMGVRVHRRPATVIE